MEFKQLEAFVAVVENKSFSEAARQLNLDPAHHQCPHQFSGTGIELAAADPHHQEAEHHPARSSAL
ncbi:MAG: LysR family transcriptional regulator [Ruminococcus sp.]